MKVCLPTQSTNGLAEPLYGHFGSAPYFTVVDTESGEVKLIDNADQKHEHGKCNPIAALANEQVDAVVVQGIGAGAVSKLGQMGIRVYHSNLGTVGEAVKALKDGKLLPISSAGLCQHHHEH